jgi:hypothetical protein
MLVGLLILMVEKFNGFKLFAAHEKLFLQALLLIRYIHR